METYKLKFTKVQVEIFRLLCIKAGEKINQNQLARILSVSPTAIAKSLPLLEQENIIKLHKSRTMNLTQIELNREQHRTIQLKRTENLRQLYQSGIIEHLTEKYPGCTIVLFGSFSKGEDVNRSDIDIAVIGTNKKSKIMKKLEKELRISTYPDFRSINKELKENICNGIVLAGGIEL